LGKKKKLKDDGIVVSFVDEPASEQVTGSMIYIKTSTHNIIVEAGLSQTNNVKEDYLTNNRKFKEFKPKDIDIIFTNHDHADHILGIPRLFRDGCNGAVVIPEKSKMIQKIMYEDCVKINEKEIEVLNAQNGTKYKPLYTMTDVQKTLEHTIEKPIGEVVYIDDTLSFKYIPSGHLLHGCQLLLYITENNTKKTILITSDIGSDKVKNRYVGQLEYVEKADVVIMESTYGNRPELKIREKERKNDYDKLQSVIDTQVHDLNSRVVIPVFAQSRAQVIATMIYELYKDKEWQPKVYIDSPLSIRIFNAYYELLEGEDKEIFDKLMEWDNLIFVKEAEDSIALVESNEPCVILSTNGFCTTGRIRHHLKRVIPDPNATILFCGYASPDSLGGILRDPKRKSITIDQKNYTCRCSVYNLKSLSGHAMFETLLNYGASISCSKLILHHGDKEKKEMLASALKKELEKRCKSTRVVIANSSLKFNL
jgi:metallo-beta-lactamase family protein